MEENVQSEITTKYSTKLEGVNKALCQVSGADLTVLAQCPDEISRIARMGAIIIATALLASFSMFFAIRTVTQSVFAGVFAGIIWGVTIFILDSYIIASYKKMDNKWRELLVILPRLILALILGLSISIPMELKVFANEIGEEIKLIRQEKESENQALANEIYRKQITPINEQKEILEKSLNVLLEPITSLTGLIQSKNDSLINEKAGKGPSGKAGDGPIAAAMQNNINEYTRQKTELLKKDSIRIGDYKRQIAVQDSLIAVIPKPAPDKIGSLYGIAIQLDALKRLKNKNSDVALAYWVFVLLILGIETAPIFVKFFTPKGKYDIILSMNEYLVDLAQKKRQSDSHQDINDEMESYSDLSHIRRERQNKINSEIMDEIANAQGEIAKKAIKTWKENQLIEVDANLESFIRTNNGSNRRNF